jgi:hypothetical protein
VTECVVKPLRDVKVTGSKPAGTKKSNHVKGWCGSGRVRSPSDFDGLDAPKSRFLKPQVNRDPTGPAQINKKKKKNLVGIAMFSTGMILRMEIYIKK